MKNKGDLSDFEYSMVVGDRQAGMCIWKTADLHGFSCATISRVYKEWSKEGKKSQWTAILWSDPLLMKEARRECSD